MTGDDCFVGRVHVRSVADLKQVIERLLPLATSNTAIIQSNTVRRRPPPIQAS